MDKEQAIEIIERHIDNNIASGSLVGQALSMAIDALKTQLCREDTTSDTISRQQAIDAIRMDISIIPFAKAREYVREAIETIYNRIEELPSVQPEPKEGHWIEEKIYRDVIECNCSECGQLMTTAATVRMNFCPNCGAKMTISIK